MPQVKLKHLRSLGIRQKQYKQFNFLELTIQLEVAKSNSHQSREAKAGWVNQWNY